MFQDAKADSQRAPLAWVLTDGKPGMENQCLGLAEALSLSPIVKRIAPRQPWRSLPPQFWAWPLAAPGAAGDRLDAPWPDILIATGRQTVAPAAAIKRRHPATVAVQIQSPGIPTDHFDLVVVPRHDRLRGDNVVTTRGALHRVTPERLAREATRFAPGLDHLPRPRVAVLIGGDNGTYRMTIDAARALADGLRALCTGFGAGLLVTPSRRTGRDNEAIIRDRLDGCAAAIWDGAGDNPYFAYLGLADAIVVTGDSVSMVSEACSTGKPVHVFDLPGGNAKFRRFHAGLREDGFTRPFTGVLQSWSYPPLDDTAVVAEAVRRRFGWPPGAVAATIRPATRAAGQAD